MQALGGRCLTWKRDVWRWQCGTNKPLLDEHLGEDMSVAMNDVSGRHRGRRAEGLDRGSKIWTMISNAKLSV